MPLLNAFVGLLSLGRSSKSDRRVARDCQDRLLGTDHRAVRGKWKADGECYEAFHPANGSAVDGKKVEVMIRHDGGSRTRPPSHRISSSTARWLSLRAIINPERARGGAAGHRRENPRDGHGIVDIDRHGAVAVRRAHVLYQRSGDRPDGAMGDQEWDKAA